MKISRVEGDLLLVEELKERAPDTRTPSALDGQSSS